MIGGTIVGIVVMEGAIYAWHRTEHNVGFLWRAFHQIHHSPRRVDIPGSVLFHPLEMTVQDDGRGIREGALHAPRSLGLLGMRERATTFHGNVTVTGAPGAGTTLTLTMPRAL